MAWTAFRVAPFSASLCFCRMTRQVHSCSCCEWWRGYLEIVHIVLHLFLPQQLLHSCSLGSQDHGDRCGAQSHGFLNAVRSLCCISTIAELSQQDSVKKWQRRDSHIRSYMDLRLLGSAFKKCTAFGSDVYKRSQSNLHDRRKAKIWFNWHRFINLIVFAYCDHGRRFYFVSFFRVDTTPVRADHFCKKLKLQPQQIMQIILELFYAPTKRRRIWFNGDLTEIQFRRSGCSGRSNSGKR